MAENTYEEVPVEEEIIEEEIIEEEISDDDDNQGGAPAPVPAPVPAPAPMPAPAPAPMAREELPELAPMPTHSPSPLTVGQTPSPAPVPAPAPAPISQPSSSRPDSITHQSDVQYIAYLKARFKLTDMEILRVLSLTSDEIDKPQMTEGTIEEDEEEEEEESEEEESGDGDEEEEVIVEEDEEPKEQQQAQRGNDDSNSFVEETISSPMVPRPPEASPQPREQGSQGSVPSGPEFKTKPIPSMDQDSDFDRESTLIRPVGAPSPDSERGRPGAPSEWLDGDEKRKTPLIGNIEGKEDIEEEEEVYPHKDVNTGQQPPATEDIERGTATTKMVQPRDQQQLLQEAYQGGAVYASSGRKRKKDHIFLGVACICCIFLSLSAVAIFLLIAMARDDVPPFDSSSDDSDRSGPNPSPVPGPSPNPSPTPTQAPLPPSLFDQPTTSMNPYVPGECDLGGQLQPNVLSQCDCNNAIRSLASNVQSRYETLSRQFIPRIYENWNFAVDSCEPSNQALVWLSTVTPKDETDLLQRYVLAKFYYQNGGTEWRSKDMWLDDIDVCVWYGVACNGQSQVVLLSLDDNNISGPIPWELGLLRFRNIGLDGNSLTGTIPGDLFLIPGLQGLSLSSNQLRGNIPREVRISTDLTTLRVDNNLLAGSLATDLGRAVALTNLDLGYNDFLGRIPTQLYQLTRLVYFSVEGNRLITGRIPTEFGRYVDLEYFSISNNALEGEIPSELGLLTMLQTLQLQNNELSGSVPTELGELTLLESLRIDGNVQLSGRIPNELCDLRSESLSTFTIGCPTRDQSPICGIPSCCTACVRPAV